MDLTYVEPGTVANFLATLNSNFDAIEASGAIDTESLASGAVTTTKISDGAVTTDKIDGDSITANKLKDNIISVNKINTSGANLSEWKEFIGNLMYPVGSYYWSSESTSPSELFGGTWEQITNKFIFAAGGSYVVGTSGGTSSTTLSSSNLPPIKGSIEFRKGIQDLNIVSTYQTSGPFTFVQNGGDKWIHYLDTGTPGTSNCDVIKFDNGGQNQSFTNMPPYLVAYCWRRTA